MDLAILVTRAAARQLGGLADRDLDTAPPARGVRARVPQRDCSGGSACPPDVALPARGCLSGVIVVVVRFQVRR